MKCNMKQGQQALALDRGIVYEQGPRHRRQKKLCTPAFERGAAMAKEIQEKNERFLASMGWKAGQKGEKGVASGEKGVASTTSRVGAAPAAAQHRYA